MAKMPELKAIFYARFHTEKGPSVIEQYPAGSIATRTSKEQQERDNGLLGLEEEEGARKEQSLLDFSDISSYIIPPYNLCGKSLSVCVNGYRLLGWPVSLESEHYPRNRFTFNVCFVLGEKEDRGREDGGTGVGMKSWEQVVEKTAHLFTALEVEDDVLAAGEEKNETEVGRGTVVKELLEKVYAQLQTYNEASIRITETHTLNLRLSPSHPLPSPATPRSNPKITSWTVPLLIRPLPSQDEWTWDLTLARIHPYLNGVNPIAKIAEKAEVEEKLVKRAVRGLMQHGRVRVLDLFHYQAIYRLTEDFGWFVRDDATLEECARYVSASPLSSTGEKPGDVAVTKSPTMTKHLLTFYTSLTTHPSVHDCVLANTSLLSIHRIDVRRLVAFGVLKGFLRRVHKYALAVAPSSKKGSGSSGGKVGSGSGSGSGGKRSGEDAAREFDRQWRRAALSSGWATPPSFVDEGGNEGAEADGGAPGSLLGSGKLLSPEKSHEQDGEAENGGEVSLEDEKLKTFLDGKHCLDEVCVAMRMSERKVLEKLRGGRGVFGEVVVFCK